MGLGITCGSTFCANENQHHCPIQRDVDGSGIKSFIFSSLVLILESVVGSFGMIRNGVSNK
jgi:hypothetical protein